MYLDSTTLDNALGSTRVAALCPTSTEVDAVIEMVEGVLESALQGAGYTGAVPASVYAAIGDVPKLIKTAAIGAWWVMAHGRLARTVPTDPYLEVFLTAWKGIQNGTLEVPSVTRSSVRAVGGVAVTESSTDVSIDDGSRPQIFSRKTMQGYG